MSRVNPEVILLVVFSIVKIVAGYTIEQTELVKFLKDRGWGTEPGEPELDVEDAWRIFMNWRFTQPRHEDKRKELPRPQYWYNEDGNPVYAFMTRRSSEVPHEHFRFQEMPVDVAVRDRFIAQTGNVLDPGKMRFWSKPETRLHVPLGVALID